MQRAEVSFAASPKGSAPTSASAVVDPEAVAAAYRLRAAEEVETGETSVTLRPRQPRL